jgi:N-acetylglucosamine kinase-like BadF-type ATPase
MNKNYFLGFDGGGTNLRGCLLDGTGEVLAVASHPPASFPKLKERIGEPVAALARDLQARAALPAAPATAAALCSTGVGRPAEREIVQRALHEKNIAETIIAESDFLAAHAGAFGGGPGIIVNAGTGVFGFGRTASGESIRVGGWGYLLGDEGSGFALAQAALIAALKDWDGRGDKTALRQSFERHFNVASIDLVISKIYSSDFDRGKFAELAPLVFEAADQGDAIANEIVRRSGRELGNLAVAAIKRGKWNFPISLALIGNLFRRRDLLLPAFWEALEEKQFDLIEPRFEPVVGAALLAIMAAGISLTDDFLKNVDRSWHVTQAIRLA